MMEYQSTRNPELHATAAQAVLQGLAPDGGLYTMPSLAQVKLDWQAVLQLDTLSMAREILAALLPSYDKEEMDKLVHAGVAPGAPQQTAGRYLGGVVDGGGLRLFQLGAGGLDGQVHIGARVAVRHGEHVQVVDGLLLPGDAGRAEQHHFLERGAVDLIYHLAVILP